MIAEEEIGGLEWGRAKKRGAGILRLTLRTKKLDGEKALDLYAPEQIS